MLVCFTCPFWLSAQKNTTQMKYGDVLVTSQILLPNTKFHRLFDKARVCETFPSVRLNLDLRSFEFVVKLIRDCMEDSSFVEENSKLALRPLVFRHMSGCQIWNQDSYLWPLYLCLSVMTLKIAKTESRKWSDFCFDVNTASKPLGEKRHDLTPTHLKTFLALLVHRSGRNAAGAAHKKVIMTTTYLIHFKMTEDFGLISLLCKTPTLSVKHFCRVIWETECKMWNVLSTENDIK